MNKHHLSFVRVSYHMIYHLVICILRFFGSKKQEILRSMQTTKMHTVVNISVKFLLMSVYKILVLTVSKYVRYALCLFVFKRRILSEDLMIHKYFILFRISKYIWNDWYNTYFYSLMIFEKQGEYNVLESPQVSGRAVERSENPRVPVVITWA